jgi:hypothetical protein
MTQTGVPSKLNHYQIVFIKTLTYGLNKSGTAEKAVKGIKVYSKKIVYWENFLLVFELQHRSFVISYS